MLDYLDNRLNRVPEIVNDAPVGLNENFAREVMELHTFGVEAGYTDADVIEVARLLTGWSTESIRLSGAGGMPDYEEFKFFADRHDNDPKTVLGVNYPAGGDYDEGVSFLAWLAAQPGTAQRLSAKLCARLIHEAPPQGAVNAAAGAWAGDGDLLSVTTAAINATAFTSPANFRSKAKPPHRYVASALMAMAATTANDWAEIEADLVAAVLDAGETPYIVGPPTGYPEDSAFWISTASMLSRVQIAQTIAWDPTLRSRLMARVGVGGTDLESIFDGVAARMIPGGVSAATRTASLEYLAIAPGGADDRYSTAAALVLSCPEFMVF